jgi:hypothetical protein
MAGDPDSFFFCCMDCFAEPVIGRAFARPVGSQGRKHDFTISRRDASEVC